MDHSLPLPPARTPRPHRVLVLRLLLMVGLAFSFGFALVPLYDVFCKATGFNGKTTDGRFTQGGLQQKTDRATLAVDSSRLVTVEFTSTVMPGLPWEVRPLSHQLDLHPGEFQTARFLVSNHSTETITAHAVPSVTPGQAAQHFEKIDCFCFTQQTLLPGEARELAVAFIVKPELDRQISTVSLAYSFFKATPSTTAAISATPRGQP